MEAAFNRVGPANVAVEVKPIAILSHKIVERNSVRVREVTLAHGIKQVENHLLCLVREEGATALFCGALDVCIGIEEFLESLQKDSGVGNVAADTSNESISLCTLCILPTDAMLCEDSMNCKYIRLVTNEDCFTEVMSKGFECRMLFRQEPEESVHEMESIVKHTGGDCLRFPEESECLFEILNETVNRNILPSL